MRIKISNNDKGNPPGKLADAELHWTDGPLTGLKLIGFAIWQRRNGAGRNVTFPARQYSVNGERRSFALLRPNGAAEWTADPSVLIRDLIIEAYDQHIETGASTDVIENPSPAPPAPEPTIEALQATPIDVPARTMAEFRAAGAAIDSKRPIGLDVSNAAIASMTPDEQEQNRREVNAQVHSGRPIALTDILSRAGKPKTPTHPAPIQPAIDF